MKHIFAILLVLLVACHPKRSGMAAGPMDRILSSPEFSSAIRDAELDLDSDEWSEKPWHYNRSRSMRELSVAARMILTIKPELQRMSVIELMGALKTTPPGSSPSFSGVAYYLFRDGNQAIVDTIRMRPKEERAAAAQFKDSLDEFWEGDNGPGNTVGQMVRSRLLPEGTIRPTTRANKTDAGNGSKAICRVIGASRSPSPDPKR